MGAPLTAWDVETDQGNPQPNIWRPSCPTCDTAYVYRRGLRFTVGEWAWYWSKDCEHTPRTGPSLMTNDGPYDPATSTAEVDR